MRYRVAVNSSRYGLELDDEVEAENAETLVLRLRELAAEVVRRGQAQSVPSFMWETVATIIESTPALAFCRYVAEEWNEEHPHAPMPLEFTVADDFAAAAESVGLLRPC